MKLYSNPKPANIDVNEIKRLRAQGYTKAQLAEHFGVVPNTISAVLKRQGLTFADITPQFDFEEVKRLRAKGYTIFQLAEHFGIAARTLRMRLRKEGLTLEDITPEGVNIPMGPTKSRNVDLEEVKRLRAMGYGGVLIARELGVSPNDIYAELRSRGLNIADITPEGVEVLGYRGGNRSVSIDIDELKQLRAQGYTTAQLAEHFDVVPDTIKRYMKKAGLTLADITPESVEVDRFSDDSGYRGNIDLEELKHLRAQGYTIGQLAEHFSVVPSTIAYRLQREGSTLADITPEDVNIRPKRESSISIDEVRQLRAQGYTIGQLAEHFGVTEGAISRRLRRAGLTLADITPENIVIPRTRLASIPMGELRQLRAQGYTRGQLAEHFGVTPHTITNHLQREGLTLADITPDYVRTRGRQPRVSIEDVKQLRAQGYTIGQLAEHFGVTESAISKRLQKEGLTLADITPGGDLGYHGRVDLEELKHLRAQGYTLGQLAEHFGVRQTSITYRLRREGLTLADITPEDVNIRQGTRIHHFDLEELKRLRAMGYGTTRIARELGVPRSAIYSRLQTEGLTIADITPEGVEVGSFSDDRGYRTNIDIEELRRLRALGYTITQLAEHFGVANSTITSRLRREGLTLADITPEDVNILPGKRVHHIDLEEMKRLRASGYSSYQLAEHFGVTPNTITLRLRREGLTLADITPKLSIEELTQLRKQGLTQVEAANRLGISQSKLYKRLRELGLRWRDLPRDNPLQMQGSAVSKTVGFGVGATATTALDYTLKKTTELSSTKRHLISGGTTTAVGLGVYATTKREDALWSAYGSLFATVGHFIYDKINGK